VSERYRKSVFGEIGHTVMSLLCDVRNFQYTIPQIDGLSIQIDGLHTRIVIPESQYDLIVKSLLTSNDYVFSFGLLQVDDACSSHLVAIENENLGSYASKTFDYNPETREELNSPQLTNKSLNKKIPINKFNDRLHYDCDRYNVFFLSSI
jgi:MAD, mothers against decapentaplegic interacting protein